MGAASGAMNRGGKTCWRAVQVQGPAGGRVLGASERLAALYRFQNGERAAEHTFVRIAEGHRRAEITDPSDIDWEEFPLLAALEAVTYEEIRRLRSLFHEGSASATSQSS